MSSKDKESQISKSKFKLFFKQSKNATGSTNERSLRPEVEWELRPETPVAQRCKTLKELGDLHLQNLNLEDYSITKLWDLTKDLIVPNKPAEYRQTALTFYKKLVHSQYKNLTLMREHFFLVIQNHDVPEDLRHRLELLETLTENGKDINNFEEKIGQFMLHWIPAIAQANLLRPYLDMLVNLIKFNAAHLDNDIVIGIVQNACHLSCTVEDNDIGLQCLTILEMVLGYTIFPCDPLPQCVGTLCRTVNHGPYCQASWKIMKNLLGTQLGFYSMKMMCNILNDPVVYEDQQLLRGAVFHLNMNIFASNVSFQVSPMFYASTVLTSFLHALDSRQVIVTYEVILSARKVVNKYKTDLSEIIWDRICDILSAIVDNIDYYKSSNISQEVLHHLEVNFHENIDFIEKLLFEERSKLLANFDRIYDLIDRVADSRPVTSVENLIEYRASRVTPTHPDWLQLLCDFMRRFYRMPKTSIRIKAVQSVVHILELNRYTYEEEILECVIIPYLSQITTEADVQLRVAVTEALISIARHCETKRCGEILDILQKIVDRPFEHVQHGAMEMEMMLCNETEAQDIITAVDGLIEVFLIKLYRLPSCHAVKIFNILVNHLELHYQRPKVFELVNGVRYRIFAWMLRARANGSFHIGFPDPNNGDAIKFSCYLAIDSSLPLYGMSHYHQRQQAAVAQVMQQEAGLVPPFTTISIRRACKIIVRCLECDRDYHIFQLVIRELPKVLQNKALIQGNDIEALANALFKIFSDNNKSHLSYKPTTDEFYALVLPVIASLVIYHQSLSPSHQASITKALSLGIFSAIANVCINTMTIMILEMPETFMRLLPDILLQMSKMSDTTVVAIPVLEFLSILSRLSNNIFTNFITRQYMYVFAISLPYTKPHRYDHYTVSLAHHVIAGWFLKVKLEYRKNIVTYIISSIQSNASMLYEDINKVARNVQRQDINSLNEDSSSRKRSTSLTERGSRNSNVRNDSDMRPLMNDRLKSFHAELAETCIDFLARHTFSPCSALPKRLPAVEYLLKDGVSQTWLVGNNLVTITTAGCPSGPARNGLCERCLQIGKVSTPLLTKMEATNNSGSSMSPEMIVVAGSVAATVTVAATATATATAAANAGGVVNAAATAITAGDQSAERRYTKVTLQHSSGNESAGSTDLTSSISTSSSHHVVSYASTQRQASNSSTASYEALSRRGSNPDTDINSMMIGGGGGGGGAGSGSGSASGSGIGAGSGIGFVLTTPFQSSSSSSSQTMPPPVQQPICVRSCTGWAEILIRRPTGNISWITRIQNPIASDCFGHDMSLSSISTLFLPSIHGGVLGTDLVDDPKSLSPRPYASVDNNSSLILTATGTTTITTATTTMTTTMTTTTTTTTTTTAMTTTPTPTTTTTTATASARMISGAVPKSGIVRPSNKGRSLQRQEEVTSSSSLSAAIDIPKVKRSGKSSHSCSVSDGELDEENANYEDGNGRCRNAVRRVNSSPEMTSSWRYSFLASKPRPLSKETTLRGAAEMSRNSSSNSGSGGGGGGGGGNGGGGANVACEPLQKKKTVGYTKDMRVSCEAIPEEITGFTPPSQELIMDDAGKMPTAVGPLKQHSADDVTAVTHILASTLRIAPKAAAAAQKITAKPPPPTVAPLSPRTMARNVVMTPMGLVKSNSGGGTNVGINIGVGIGLSKGNGGGGGGGGGGGVGGHGHGHGHGHGYDGVMPSSACTDYNNGDMIRGRSKTISVVREVNGKSRPSAAATAAAAAAATSNFRLGGAKATQINNTKLCMNPSFVFMQLYHTGQLQVTDVPMKVPPEHMNVLTLLDLAAPFETHTIGVLYVGRGQCNNEAEILRNAHGSVRYVEFLRSIGTLVSLKHAKENNLFIKMDTGGLDGKFTYIWKDDIVQVTFHVATLMPTNMAKDPNCYEKKKNIGNDFVIIVYNESGEDYNLNTIATQFNYACVIVQPLELNTNRIYVKARPEISKFVCHPDVKIVSDASAPLLARQLALHANLAALVYQSVKKKNPYASNWLERLRFIKRLRAKLIDSQNNQRQSGSAGDIDDNPGDPSKRQKTNRDFTKYT